MAKLAFYDKTTLNAIPSGCYSSFRGQNNITLVDCLLLQGFIETSDILRVSRRLQSVIQLLKYVRLPLLCSCLPIAN